MADLRKLVEKSVEDIFNRVGTLAEVIVLHPKGEASFNFSDMTSTQTTQTPLSVRAIRLKNEKQRSAAEHGVVSDSNVSALKFLIRAKGLPTLNEYAMAEINGVFWSIVHPIVDDGYTLTLTLKRET